MSPIQISKRIGITIVVVVLIVAGVAAYYLTLPPPVTKNEIVIGRTLAFTGKYSKEALYAQKGWECWIDMVNENGGIFVKEYGKKLKVRAIYYDDGSDPTTATELYRKLIEVDKVDFIIGPYASAVTYAVQAVAESYKMLFLASEGTSVDLWKRGLRYSVMAGPAGVDEGRVTALYELIKALPSPPKKIAAIGEDTAFPKGIVDAAEQFAGDYGYQIVYRKLWPVGTTDLTPIVTAARDSGAEVLVGGTYYPDALQIVRICKEIKFSPKVFYLTIGPSLPEWGSEVRSDGEYILCPTDYLPEAKSYQNDELLRRFKQKYGQGESPTYHSGRDFACGQILQQSIEATGTLNQDKLLEYVLSGVEFKTATGPRKIGPWKQYSGVPSPPSYLLMEWQKGKIEVVYPFEIATAKHVYPFPPWDQRS